MNEPFSAIYRDAYGQELVDITTEKDGEFLSMTLRDIHFRGLGFDFFYVWPQDQAAEKLRRFHLRNAGGVEYTQEFYLCPEFEVDLRWVEIVR